MRDFAAIDFETANGYRSSVCSIGIVVVKDGKISKKFYSLIKPVPNFYSYRNVEVHGLTKIDTDEADYFPEVWDRAKAIIDGLPLVAHNSPFDEGCLRAVHEVFKMDYPGYDFYCTLRASRRTLRLPNHKLHTVSEACGYDLRRHHHALADAIAASHIWLYLTEGELLIDDQE